MDPLLQSTPMHILLDSGVKGLLLLSVAGLALAMMRHASASARHLVLVLALGGLIVLPFVSMILPKWQLQVLPKHAEPVAQAAAVSKPMPLPQTIAAPSAQTGLRSDTNVAAPEEARFEISMESAMIFGWLIVASLMVMPLIAGSIAISRITRTSREFEDASWAALARSLGESIGVRRTVRLLCTAPGTMPMTTGVFRPVILLPRCAHDWPEEKRRSVLLHELAHIKRHDCLTQALARVAVAMHWFNPLAWLALRRLRIERERACDDLVLTAGERPSSYADHLLEIARTMTAGALAASAAITMARKSQLEGRVVAVLDPKRNRRALEWKAYASGVLVLIGLALPLGMLELSARGDSVKQEYEIQFSQGVRATVLGVGEPGSDPHRASWLPDGTLLGSVPAGFEKIGAKVHPNEHEVAREFYINARPSSPNQSVQLSWKIDGKGGAGGSHGDNEHITMGLAVTVPAGQKESVLELGVAAGPWETLFEGAPGNSQSKSSPGGELGVVFSDVVMDKGQKSVLVTHNIHGRDYRIVAFDSAGKSHLAGESQSSGVAGAIQCRYVFDDWGSTNTITRLEFQVRDYEWRKIAGIALHPKTGVAPRESRSTSGVLQFRFVDTDWFKASENGRAEQLPFLHPDARRGGTSVWVSKEVLMSESDVESVKVVPSSEKEPDRYALELRFTEQGTEKFRTLTEQNIRRQLAIVIMGKVLAAPNIAEPITGGKAQLSGGMSKDEAESFAAAIRASMPRQPGVRQETSKTSDSAKLDKPLRRVRLAVDRDRMTFEGREVTLDQLYDALAAVPDRSKVVIEFARTMDLLCSSDRRDYELSGKTEDAVRGFVRSLGFHSCDSEIFGPLGSLGSVRQSGPLEYDQPIACDLHASTVNQRDALSIDRITIRRDGNQIKPMIDGSIAMAPRSFWSVRIQLYDSKGNVRARASASVTQDPTAVTDKRADFEVETVDMKDNQRIYYYPNAAEALNGPNRAIRYEIIASEAETPVGMGNGWFQAK